jgi:Ca2+-binding RTX toxin-like protein
MQNRFPVAAFLALVIISFVFISASMSPLQRAFANGYLLSDLESCESEPLFGNWDEVSTTCFVEGFTLEPGDILDISSGVALQNNGMISNNGGIIDNHGILSNADTIDNKGTINNYDAINNEGTLNNNEGIIVNSGSIYNLETINNDGTINNLFGGVINNDHNLNNFNIIVNFDGGTINTSDTINNHGTINNSGSIDNGGTTNNYGTISNFQLFNNNGMIDNFCTGIIIGFINGNQPIDMCSGNPIVANDQTVVTNEDTPQPITLTAVSQGTDPLTFILTSLPSRGILSGSAPDLVYTPNVNFFGTDSFTFVASDGTLDSNTATVMITVIPIDDPPAAVDDMVTTNEDNAITIDVMKNDGDIDMNDDTAIISVTNPANGIAINNGHDVTYIPNPNYYGPDSFVYTVSDISGSTAEATVWININPVNDAPVANDQTTVVTPEDTVTTISLDATDPENDGLSYSIMSPPSHGTLSGAAPNLQYTPAANYFGSDSFMFEVSDGELTDTATVLVTINPVNDNPIALNDIATTSQDTAVTVNVLTNDGDVDSGDTLTVQSVTNPANGVAVIDNGGNTVTYTPASTFVGSDSFDYTVSDGHGGTATATVSITVNAANSNPTAVDDIATTDQGIAVTINVLTNDSDPDGDQLTVQSITTTPAHGTVTINSGSTTITYIPVATFAGTDSFTYAISDGKGGTATASVTVTINAVPPPPPPTEELFCGMPINSFDRVIDGTSGNDNLIGTNGDDLIRGFEGNDVIVGGNGDDCIIGGDGNDRLWGSNGDDVIEGGNGNDKVYGGNGDDIINGNSGNDLISGGNGNDIISGGDGDDTIYGKNGNDVLNGGNGNDQISDNNGNEIIDGGSGTDNCYDKKGTNTIVNCEGHDKIKEEEDDEPEPKGKSR